MNRVDKFYLTTRSMTGINRHLTFLPVELNGNSSHLYTYRFYSCTRAYATFVNPKNITIEYGHYAKKPKAAGMVEDVVDEFAENNERLKENDVAEARIWQEDRLKGGCCWPF